MSIKHVIVKSFKSCIEYYISNKSKEYVIISIQNTPNGFGKTFKPKGDCLDVITLIFDDIEHKEEGYRLMTKEQAKSLAEFIRKNKEVDTFIVHCEFGQSRSVAIGRVISEKYGAELKIENRPVMNRYVYNLLKQELNKRKFWRW